MDGYDIIGDIHGREEELRLLLERLGYQRVGDVFRHRARQALFVGDFIDRYPARGVLAIVRPMVEAGTALAVMGNHELNAIAYDTPDPQATATFMREHSGKNRDQHEAFIDEYAGDDAARAEAIEWFKTLPLWLDLGELRVVHAAWYEPGLETLGACTDGAARLTETGIIDVNRRGTEAFRAAENVVKGVEFSLPAGAEFHDKSGTERHNVRVKWWREGNPAQWRDIAIGPPALHRQLLDEALRWPAELGYPENAPPVFFGHYWWAGEPAPIAANVACVDYSAGLPGGQLAAYRFSGEEVLAKENFVAVPRLDAAVT